MCDKTAISACTKWRICYNLHMNPENISLMLKRRKYGDKIKPLQRYTVTIGTSGRPVVHYYEQGSATFQADTSAMLHNELEEKPDSDTIH